MQFATKITYHSRVLGTQHFPFFHTNTNVHVCFTGHVCVLCIELDPFLDSHMVTKLGTV
jgi:hypothetical protein